MISVSLIPFIDQIEYYIRYKFRFENAMGGCGQKIPLTGKKTPPSLILEFG